MGRLVPFLVLSLVIIFSVSGCSRRYRLSQERMTANSPWPFVRGGLSAAGAFQGGEFAGSFEVIWQRKEGDKPAGPLTIYHNSLIYPGSKKQIKFFDLSSGRKQGRIKSRGLAQSGVVIQDSIAFFAVGPRKNRLSGYNLIRGKRLWREPVKDAAHGSIFVNNRLIVSSGDGVVMAVEPATGETIWRFTAKDKFLVSASYGDGKLFQPGDQGHLYILSAEDGTAIDTIDTQGPLVSQAVIADLTYLADVLGNVYAIDAASGEIVWQVMAGGPVWSAPAVDRGLVIVGHSGGEVVALKASTGEEIWRFETDEVVRAAPLIVGEFVIAGTAAGKVYCLRADDGTEVGSQQLTGGILFPPVTDGTNVYVATQLGRIACFGDRHEQISTTNYRKDAREELQ